MAAFAITTSLGHDLKVGQLNHFFMRKMAISCVAVFLCACAARGPLYQPGLAAEPGKALLYIYRTETEDVFEGLAPMLVDWGISVYVNDTSAATLRRGEYAMLTLKPGKYELRFDHNFVAGSLELELASEQIQYVKLYKFMAREGATPKLKVVSESAASAELKMLHHMQL